MLQIAVFVDADHVYAQGSALLRGKRQRRELIKLSEQQVLERLADITRAIAPNTRLLRIYRYGGLLGFGRPSQKQELIGKSSNTKLRLGSVESSGQQKGVDSLIVTDALSEAPHHAIHP